MKITNRIYAINLFINRAYLIVEDKLILIDSGFPGSAHRIIKFIRSIGRNEKELKLIILTHYHIDHKGSARKLKSLTGAKIAAHVLDAPYIEGKIGAFRKVKNPFGKFFLFIAEILFLYERVKVDILLKDGDEINHLKVIHTPGHTMGSISLYDSIEKVIFSGDTMPPQLGKMGWSRNPYSVNSKMEKESLKKLMKLDFEKFLPTDGKMVLKDAKRVLSQFV